MSSYCPIYVEQLRLAARYLDACALKVLLYLCSRADEYGRSFPSVATIAEDIGYANQNHVYAALSALEHAGYIGYLSRASRDRLTGRWLPNVYIVSPLVIHVRDYEGAWALWNSAGYNRHPSPLSFDIQVTTGQEGREYSQNCYTNQQQNHQSKPTTVTNDSNQYPTTTAPLNTEGSTALAVAPTAAQRVEKISRERETQPAKISSAASSAASGAQLKTNTPPSSAAPPRAKTPKRATVIDPYPDPIATPLPNAGDEAAAASINRAFSIPMVRCRGLIKRYGVQRVLKAADVVQRGGSDWSNPGGAVIYLLRSGLGAQELDRAGDDNRYTTGKYAGFVE